MVHPIFLIIIGVVGIFILWKVFKAVIKVVTIVLVIGILVALFFGLQAVRTVQDFKADLQEKPVLVVLNNEKTYEVLLGNTVLITPVTLTDSELSAALSGDDVLQYATVLSTNVTEENLREHVMSIRSFVDNVKSENGDLSGDLQGAFDLLPSGILTDILES